MNSLLNLAESADEKILLSKLPDCFSSSMKSAQLRRAAGGKQVICSIEIPGVGQTELLGSSAEEAIRLAVIELASALARPSFLNSLKKVSVSDSETNCGTGERFHSKSRQLTVGVTMPKNLRDHLTLLANAQNESFAEVSRRFTTSGFEDLTSRSLFISTSSLMEILGNELRKWQSPNSEQIMLRVEAKYAVRIKSAAKEYKKSASELAVLSMAHGLVLQEQLVLIEKKVSECRGAAIRSLLPKVGLESYAASLLSGVLAGSIKAPKELLYRLANNFDVPESLLTTFFRRSFDSRMIPSFKAEDGKPQVTRTVTTWSTAVKLSDLPPDQTKALLNLGT